MKQKHLIVYKAIQNYPDSTLDEISKVTEFSKPTIRKLLKELEEENYIKIKKEGVKNIYEFIKSPPEVDIIKRLTLIENRLTKLENNYEKN